MANKSYKFMQLTGYLGVFLLLISTMLPIHDNPIPTLQVEIVCAVGLFILCLNFYNHKDFALRLVDDINPNDKYKIFPRIPKIAIMPMLLSMVAIYHIAVYNHFSSTVMMNSIVFAYCICMFLAISVAYNLRIKGYNLFNTLAYGLVFIGVINFIIMALQALGLAEGVNIAVYNFTNKINPRLALDTIMSAPVNTVNLRPFGNLNQPNHMVTIIAWSIISWIYIGFNCLHKNNNISLYKKYAYFAIGLLLCIALVLPASRSIYLHMLTFAVVFVLYYKNVENQKSVLLVASFVFVTIIASIYFISVAKYSYKLPIATLLERNENTELANNLRSILRQHGWIMFKQNPIFGVSYGNFSWAQFINSSLAPNGEIANSSHNIIIDLLAKTGIVGLLICFVPVLMWTIQRLKSCLSSSREYFNSSTQIFALGIIACLIGHSMLEYPQNYLFFLIPACLVIGYTSTNYISFLKKSRVILSSLLLLAVSYTTIISIDFKSITQPRRPYETVQAFILYPYSDYQTIATLRPEYIDKVFLRIHLNMAENASHFLSSPPSMKNYIILLAIDGQFNKALSVLDNILNFVNIPNKKEYIASIYNLTQDKFLKADKNMQKFAIMLKEKHQL